MARKAPEVNAGSMADIAFLLLIFFLVTTTIETDSGINRKLPPMEDQIDPPIIREKNIFTVVVNKNNQLLVEESLIDIKDLRGLAVEFLDNGGGSGEEACNYCQGDRDSRSSDNPDKAIISLKNDRETQYKVYIAVQNELVAAYNVLRNREFARLNLSHTITSKRKLMYLVDQGHVSGWDDPRMPTVSGLRRRGYPPNSLLSFVNTVGVAKRENSIEASLLEFCAREELNKSSKRVMVVLDPLKITITNYPKDKKELITTENNPEDSSSGARDIPFEREILIEKEDFRLEANRKFFRLKIGKEVRLKSAYIICANEAVFDQNNNIIEVKCTYDPLSKSGSGSPESERKVKGTLHWVSKNSAVSVEVREYDRLFLNPSPSKAKTNEDLSSMLNPNSIKVLNALAEPSIKNSKQGDQFQFQRKGYFIVDQETNDNKIIFNKTVGLRDNWKTV